MRGWEIGFKYCRDSEAERSVVSLLGWRGGGGGGGE